MLLGAEGRTDLEDALKASEYCQLLVQLRALREVCWGLKVLQREQVGATFGGSGDDLRGVDLLKALGNQVVAAVLQDLGAQLEHGVHMRAPQVEVTIV